MSVLNWIGYGLFSWPSYIMSVKVGVERKNGDVSYLDDDVNDYFKVSIDQNYLISYTNVLGKEFSTNFNINAAWNHLEIAIVDKTIKIFRGTEEIF